MQNILPAWNINPRTFAQDQTLLELRAKILELRKIGGYALNDALEKYRRILA
jgi:hypothetical protein